MTLLNNRAVRLSTAKACVFPDSVLCMGRISESSASAWKQKIDGFMYSFQCRELDRIDWEPMVFDWKNFPGFTTLQILAEIQNMITEKNVSLSNFWDESSSCQCTTTLYGERKKRSTELCTANPKTVTGYARRFAHGHRSFLGPGSEKTWYGTHTHKPKSLRTRRSTSVKVHIPCSVDPVLSNGYLCEANEVESVFTLLWWRQHSRIGSSHNHIVKQLSIYGAVADMCAELACRISGCSESTGKLVAQNNSETMAMPTELSAMAKPPLTNETVQGDLLRDYERKIANLPNNFEMIRLCYNVGMFRKDCWLKGQYRFDPRRCGTCQIGRLMSRVHFTSTQLIIQSRGIGPWEHEDRSSFGRWPSVTIKAVTESRSLSTPYLTMEPTHGLWS